MNSMLLVRKYAPHLFSSHTFFILLSGYGMAFNIVQYLVFMRLFQFRELGILTLLHTVISLVGMTQVGLLNGGFRIFSQHTPNLEPRVNNTVFSFFAALGGLVLLYAVVGMFFNPARTSFIAVGALIGLLTMCRTWLTNICVAHRQLTRLNWVNFLTTTGSLFFFLLIPKFGLFGGILVVASAPALFVMFFLLRYPELRPKQFELRIKNIRWILLFGFIPFLTGILAVLNLEIGNLAINFFLGKEALGKFMLVQLYTSCFLLVPTTLNALFLPRLLPLFRQTDTVRFRHLLWIYLFLLLGYCLLVVVVTFGGMPMLVSILFPKYRESLVFVYMILPGLLATAIYAPVGMILYLHLILKPVFYVYCVSVFLTISGIGILVAFNRMSLINVAGLKTLINLAIVGSLGFYYLTIKKKLGSVRCRPSG